MAERAHLIEWIRGEVVGPSRWLTDPTVIEFGEAAFVDTVALRRGPLAWRPAADSAPEEVLYYDRESPHRKYGVGLLHPSAIAATVPMTADNAALQASDTIGAEIASDEVSSEDGFDETEPIEGAVPSDDTDDFEVSSPDVRHPSTIGISFCIRLGEDGRIVVTLPQNRLFSWQDSNSIPFPTNGRYEPGKRRWTDDQGTPQEAPVWRRRTALETNQEIIIHRNELVAGRTVRRDVSMPEGSPLNLRLEVFPRYRQADDTWLLTLVLRNSTQVGGANEPRTAILYQTYFEMRVEQGQIERYPESQRPFDQLDAEEKSLALLYRESATWGVGHGCSAGWDTQPGESPEYLYADVFPAVQLPSMTPDIKDASGNKIQLSMRILASLSDDGIGEAWQSLENLAYQYEAWIQGARNEAETYDERWQAVALEHLNACSRCLDRINNGISLLRNDARVRQAFRLANLAMLLQQIGTKQLMVRQLGWNHSLRLVMPQGEHRSPWDIFHSNSEAEQVGKWRAFQIAFLLMSLAGMADGNSPDREVVDLIWFPTGGGKTEAYLAVMAFYMFHQRLLMNAGDVGPQRDGTNVLMRYTLRMLTTQQFQRAASLICAMEFLRRQPALHGCRIPGQRFSLGLWIGGDGSPNNINSARTELNEFRRGSIKGNPLVLTECPWCRAEIGRYEGTRPNVIPQAQWNAARTRGISEVSGEGPLLHCPDAACPYGQEETETWLPVEVIDQRIYRKPPSLVIGTADKLAIVAYRPQAGAIFGRRVADGRFTQIFVPPGLIVQDELHLISGPLGTVYGLYEGIFERLCSFHSEDRLVRPKLIASTATIRGAADQVMALYARPSTNLFPAPGLLMGDSFFGRYAKDDADERLAEGRLYLGIHASDYGSILTTEVRAFSSALFRPFSFAEDRRDPWWTLLAFYNSIRELGGAKTLFDSDIRSRLKFMFNREGFQPNNRRTLRIVEELTSRLTQAEIVEMMNRLSRVYSQSTSSDSVDACLASNMIEVGVDIDRLSLMGVIGQPKTTASYIQVTGRIGRRWWDRAGLVLMIYNPSKSRDRSHFEQFHSYHRRLYERVEPTSATPFALSAIERALPGALITWARQQTDAPVSNKAAYDQGVRAAFQLLRERCQLVVRAPEDQQRSLDEMERVRAELEQKWGWNPQQWEEFPQAVNGEYLMLWPGQFATVSQKQRGVVIPSSMRQVDREAELIIDQGYGPTSAA